MSKIELTRDVVQRALARHDELREMGVRGTSRYDCFGRVKDGPWFGVAMEVVDLKKDYLL